jgi:hypothetical protein
MYTSLFLFALAGYSAQAALVPVGPKWRDDYAVAHKLGQKEKKPLAVFVGSGSEGWNRLSSEGRFGKDIEQLLNAHYVCVYLDTNNDDQRKLASQFDIEGARGLIISDRTGSKQAFHYEGRLSNEDLARSLRKYADPDRIVERTDATTRDPVPAAPAQYSSRPVAGRSC